MFAVLKFSIFVGYSFELLTWLNMTILYFQYHRPSTVVSFVPLFCISHTIEGEILDFDKLQLMKPVI